MKQTKRTLAILLAVLLLALSMPFAAVAEESGTYQGFNWTLSDDGVLTITGSGTLEGNADPAAITWNANRAQIKKVILESGITTIKGSNFFVNCPELATVVFPASLTYIGANTFKDVTEMPTVYYCGTEEQWADVINNSTALTADVLQYHVEHTFAYTPNTDGTHNAVCSVCAYKADNLACSGGTATCTSKAVCVFCGEEYGETTPHTESTNWTSNGSQHWKVCTECSAVLGEKVNHTPGETWGNNETYHFKVCTVCGYDRISRAKHTAADAYSADGTQHWKECKDCGYIMVAKEDHNLTDEWSNDGTQHWKICTVCNQPVNTAAHNESTEWSKSSTKHWKVCTDCGLVLGEQVNHTPDETWEKNETYHWKVCTVCGYDRISRARHTAADAYSADGTQHWKVCKDCGYVMTEPEDHTASTEWTVEGNQHYKLCTVCGNVVGTKEDHIPTEKLQSNKTQHWSECSVCKAVLGEKVNHTTPDNWTTSDTQHWKECPDCGYVLTKKTNHTEMSPLEADDNQHWTICAGCGMELTERTDHDWDYANASLKEWATDYSTCTVTVACTGCEKTQDITTNWVGKKVTQQPTCQAEGVREYTATFSNAEIPAQVMNEAIPKTEHKWETNVKFEQQGDNWYAYGTCVNHPLSPIQLAATKEEVTPRTCEADQTIHYYVELNGFKYCSDIMTGLPALGHNYQFKGIEWTGLEEPAAAPTAVGRFVCSNDTKHIQTPDASVSFVSSTDPGCVTSGEKVFKATVTFNGSTYDDQKTVVISKTGHNYGDWESNGNGTHTHVCADCAVGTEGHSETANCFGGTATCIAEAVCEDCGTAYGELGDHNYGTWIEEEPASCTKQGTLGHYHCKVCGKDFDADHNVLNSLVIEKNAHSYTKKTVKDNTLYAAATCTQAAKYYYSCAGCDAIENNADHTFTDGDALGHDFSGAYQNVADGTHNRKCSRCEAYGIDTTENATEACSGGTATCTEKAVCALCDTAYGNVDSTNHNWVENAAEDYLKAAADCTNPAEYYKSCSRCGTADEEATFTVGSALGHDWSEATYAWATDYSKVTAERHCTREGCEAAETETAAATGEQTAVATCVDEGIMTYTSAAFKNEVFKPQVKNVSLGKDMSNHVGETYSKEENKVPPTYTSPGSYDKVTYCDSCKKVVSRETYPIDIIPHQHEYTSVVTAEPNCTYEGERTFTCQICGNVVTESIATNGKCADADNDGYCDYCKNMMTGGDHCPQCGKIHNGGFGDRLTGFFHRIAAFFTRLFR